MIDIRHPRYLAEHIPRAKLVELPGKDALAFGDEAAAELDDRPRRLGCPTRRVLVSGTVKDLAVGSGIQFEERGD